MGTGELELVTVAFAVLNAGNYYLWWNKPLSLHYAFPFVWTPSISSSEGDRHDHGIILIADFCLT